MTETKQYWLECECGEKHKVAAHQAGSDLSCSCGKTLAVPRLIQLKKLPPAFEESSEKEREENKDPSRKILLSVGVFVLLTGLILIGYGFTKRPTLEAALISQTEFSYQGELVYQDFAPLTDEELVLSLLTAEDLEGIPPSASWSLWLALEKGPQPSSSLENRINTLRIHYYAWLGIGIAVTLIGLITLGSAAAGKAIHDKAAKAKTPGAS